MHGVTIDQLEVVMPEEHARRVLDRLMVVFSL